MTGLRDLKKGAAWEYRVHRALFASGWYVRRNIDLRERIAGSPQIMAEVDLLGLSFDASLVARRLVAECKDRKGSTKEADRVIWLLGLGRLLEAEELLFAKPTIAPATVHFARSTSVALHEEAGVLRIESMLPEPAWVGSFDPEISEDLIRVAVDRNAFGDSRLRDAYDWVHNASWYEEPLARLRRLPGYFRLVTGKARADTRHVLMIEGLLAVLACGLEVAGLLRRHAPQVARALASEGLASGVATAGALREIGARADEYYRDVVERVADAAGGERLMLNVPRLADHIARPPRWADGFFSLAESLGARPEAATDVLRYAELELFESLAGRDPQPALSNFVRSDHAWLAAALSSAAGFCQRYWSIEDPLLSRLVPTPVASAHECAPVDDDNSIASKPLPPAAKSGAVPKRSRGGRSQSAQGESRGQSEAQASLLDAGLLRE